MIPCFTAYGQLVPAAKITFRPAVYGILLDEYQQVFLARAPGELFWTLPGGMLQPHQTPQAAVRYYFRQAAGITPLVDSLLFVDEQYHYMGENTASHVVAFYYQLRRPTATAVSLAEVDEATIEGRWFPLADLSRQELHFGFEAIRAAQKAAQRATHGASQPLDNPFG